ncbi:uncharacterized protein LOC129613571 [Condylostylus longicornis]|uniref:uncharacterized protein LOC129613571 n=1 Tax=Condylostylus longicornis TaxID=2530218 RepID=UPI00244DD078|nr:uncharacterized protein LOC129613571 [Condylostylus longicornis]
MALRKQPIVSAIGNENIGIMSNGINIKNNLANRPKSKQPLGNINNTIHNQLGRNNGGTIDIERKKKNLIQANNEKQLPKSCKIFQDEFDDFCSFKNDDKTPEQKWLDEEIANSRIFEKIIEADKPRTKPITKAELDWIEFFEFGEKNNDIAKDIDSNDSFELPELEIPKLPNINFKNLRAPSPPIHLFEDLDISDVENILQNDEMEAPTPIITANFDDSFNF